MPTSLLKNSVDYALANGYFTFAEKLLRAWAEQHAMDCGVSFDGDDGQMYAFTEDGWERWDDRLGAVCVERADLPPGLVFCGCAED